MKFLKKITQEHDIEIKIRKTTKKCQTHKTMNKLECGPMPNVMVALPNIGGALCSTPQSLADAHY